MSQKLRFALDFGPLLAFFAGYQMWGLMAATVALIACTLISLAILYAKERKLALTPLVTGIAVTFFGGLTLLLQDETFIKIKPTFVNLLFAAILFAGLATGRPLLKYVLESAFKMDEHGWRVLTRRWAFFFVGLAALNEVIWRNFSMDFWVSFKVFGMLTVTILFTLAQIPLISRHMLEEEQR